MFLVVGLNPTLDVVMRMRAPAFGQLNIAEKSAAYPSGKAANLTRYLAQLGNDATLLGFIGHDEYAHFADSIAASGARQHFTVLDAPTRINVKIIDSDSGQDTEFNMRGPSVTPEQLAAVEATIVAQLPGVKVMALTGSLPPGVPVDTYARWIRLAREHHVPTALDASGKRLSLGLASHPWLVKVNWFELSQQVGEESVGEMRAAGMLRDWIASGTGIACVTRADRVLMATPEGMWEVTTPRQVAQNPVGAGDALLAGLLNGWRLSLPPQEMLLRACATAVSSVLSLDPGSFSPADYEMILPQVKVERKA